MKVLLVLSALVLSSCTVVGPGERGVRVSLGKVGSEPEQPGAYLWIPFILGMTNMNVQVQKAEVESTAATMDMQDVHAHVAVNWSLSPDNVVSTYKSIGSEDEVAERILIPAVNEVMKAATAKRSAEQVLTQRADLKKDIDDGLKARLAHYGITLEDVSIVNLSFSKDFTDAIERKQIAEQDAKQAEYVAKKATQEANADIERAKGQAESQRLLKTTITREILQQRAIEKWNGQLPQIIGSGGAVPFINVNAVGESPSAPESLRAK